MGSLLAWLTTLIVAVLAALFAVPYLVNWNDYKSFFEEQTGKVFGRAVHIDGDINLTFLPIPQLKMRGLRVADEFGSFLRPFAEADTFNVILSLPAILTGTIEARTLELEQPVIRFAVDELGEGNWQSVRPHNFDLPVRQVILSKADIHNGTVEFRHGNTGPVSRIDRISGTLTADSLTGPFRFTGLAAIGGESREMRLSGGLEKGGLRLKGAIRSATGASIYQLDGDVKGFDGPLQYSGPVVVRLALDKAAREATGGALGETAPGKAIELRASATISLEDVQLENMAFTLTQDDRPQSLSGSAYASWGDKPRLDVSVEAPWFDIDQMLRVAQDKTKGDAQPQARTSDPAAAIAALPQIFTGWSFKPQQGSIKARFQQTGLGGDSIEGLDLAAVHDQGGWRIDKLAAKLPGDTDIDVKGTVAPGDKFSLAGEIKVKGKNLPRLLRWAAPSLGAVDAGDTQHFSLTSGLTFGSSKIAFKSAKGEFGESTFSGDLVYDFGEASQLLVTLQSERLDLRPVFGGRDPASYATGWAAQADGAGGAAAEGTAAQATPVASLADVARTVFHARRSQVSVRVAQLQLPDFEARDVRSALRYEDGTLEIRDLNLSTTSGLSVKAEGRLTSFEQTPNGAITLAIQAPTPASVANLARLAGLANHSSAAQKRMDALAPLRLTGSLNASRQARALQLSLAGSAAGSELTLAGKLDGDVSKLTEAKFDLSGVIANADGRRLIAQLAPEVPLDPAAASGGAGALNVSAAGGLKTGLATKLELRTPEAQGRFEGLIAPLDTPWSASGDISLRAAQAATALSMLRVAPGGTPVTGELSLHASVSKKGTAYEVGALDLQIGGETVGGSIKVDTSGARPQAAIDIGAGAVILPKIAAYLVDWDRKDITSQLAEAAGGKSLWPNQAFSLRAFEAADGTLKVKAKTLALTDEMVLGEAALQASLKDGALTVSRLDGELYGGTFEGSGSLAATRGRFVLDGRAKLDKADLAGLTLASDNKPVARGKGDIELELRGEGLSPRGLISVVNGKGQVRLQKGTLAGLSPTVLRDAADAYMAQEVPQKDKLVQRVTTELRRGNLAYPPLTLPVSVKDGVVHVQGATIEGQDYEAKGKVLVDLAALRLDSEWDVGYTGKTRSGEKLPPVQLVFAGPLYRFATLQPQVNVEPLERFLSIRRMDQDMERLEKLGRPGATLRDSGKPRAGVSAGTLGGAGGTAGTGNAPGDGAVQAIPPSRADPAKQGDQGASGNWNTGTEETPAANAGDFETRMRRAIGGNSQAN